MEEFRKLGIIEPILQSIKEEKFEVPSEIQARAIPLIIEGKDVIGGSATGSGKTLAFSAGIIQNAPRGKGIQALVLTPTRELAEQVGKAMRTFARHYPLKVAIVYGGVSINPQINELRKADVVVGTPGRVLDHMERRTVNFSNVKTLVLDEADRMLDMGFIDDVERIIRACPRDRQTLLFSATISEEIARLSHKYMKDPVKVAVKSHVDPTKLRQAYYDVPDGLKFSLLVHLLKNESAGLVMVFCNTRMNADFVVKNLKGSGIDALAIHGGFSQAKRSRVMDTFHAQKVYVLVCTDVAARGIDVPDVSHVYNYDTPKDSKQYIHRIGRTARAGKEGIAITILGSRDYENFSRVIRENRVKVEQVEMPRVERVAIKKMDVDRGGRGGDRRRTFGRNRAPHRGRRNWVRR